MKFTLLFYTDDWETGPTVELAHVPSPGSVVWIGDRYRKASADMYYVDNVMYPERSLGDDEIYLYVRPYTGYTRFAPKTEADRIIEKLNLISDSLKDIGSELKGMRLEASGVRDNGLEVNKNINLVNNNLDSINDRLYGISDVLEDGQGEVNTKLDNISLILEELKESL